MPQETKNHETNMTDEEFEQKFKKDMIAALQAGLNDSKDTKIVWLLTRKNHTCSDEGINFMSREIKQLYNDNSKFLIDFGPRLNDPENLANLLEQNSGTGYLAILSDNGFSYFTGEPALHAAATMIRMHPDIDPWTVLMYILKKNNPGDYNDEDVPDFLDNDPDE